MNAEHTTPSESGLGALVLLLRLHGIAVDAAHIRHQFGGTIGVNEMLRCAKELKLKANVLASDVSRLGKTPFPAIAEGKDGSFLIVGKVSAEGLLVQHPAATRPEIVTLEAFEAFWSGRLVLMARRAALGE